MTLQECYEKMGGDYEEVLARLISQERIAKYMVKFLDRIRTDRRDAHRKAPL